MSARDDFGSFPDIPPPPTDMELNSFFVMCAEAMSGQPVTPLVLALKGAVSLIAAQRAEIERLRVEAGLPTATTEEAVAVLGNFIEQVREQ